MYSTCTTEPALTHNAGAIMFKQREEANLTLLRDSLQNVLHHKEGLVLVQIPVTQFKMVA